MIAENQISGIYAISLNEMSPFGDISFFVPNYSLHIGWRFGIIEISETERFM